MATTQTVSPWAAGSWATSWRSAASYDVQAPNDQGDPTDWGVTHPPTKDTTVVPSMPTASSANPFAEGLDYYGFESYAVYDTTPGPTSGAHGTAAMSTSTDHPAWDQPAGTRHQADTGGPARQYRELKPNYGRETGKNITTMSTDDLNTRRPDGTFDSVPNGHIANDIQAPRNNVDDLGTRGWIQYSERPVWNNVATPAAQVTAPQGAFSPVATTPWLMQQPSNVPTDVSGNVNVPDPYVAPSGYADTAFDPYASVM